MTLFCSMIFWFVTDVSYHTVVSFNKYSQSLNATYSNHHVIMRL